MKEPAMKCLRQQLNVKQVKTHVQILQYSQETRLLSLWNRS